MDLSVVWVGTVLPGSQGLPWSCRPVCGLGWYSAVSQGLPWSCGQVHLKPQPDLSLEGSSTPRFSGAPELASLAPKANHLLLHAALRSCAWLVQRPFGKYLHGYSSQQRDDVSGVDPVNVLPVLSMTTTVRAQASVVPPVGQMAFCVYSLI